MPIRKIEVRIYYHEPQYMLRSVYAETEEQALEIAHAQFIDETKRGYRYYGNIMDKIELAKVVKPE